MQPQTIRQHSTECALHIRQPIRVAVFSFLRCVTDYTLWHRVFGPVPTEFYLDKVEARASEFCCYGFYWNVDPQSVGARA